MWRFVLILALAVSAVFVSPVRHGEAGFAACISTTRDVDIDILGFNYLWASGIACIGEDWEKAHISVDLEYYDWNDEEWRFLRVAGTASEYNDQDILAWGAENVGPYLGINCRRIDAAFFFTHSGRQQSFSDQSNGECY